MGMKTILALALAALAAAEPEADADAYYRTYGYGLGGYYGGYHGLGYRTYGYGHGLYYGKREAEAEPYYGVYSAHHAVAPVVSYAHAPVVSSYAQVSPSASLSTVGLAHPALPAVAGGYAGAGRYVANSAGTVHVAKREAEAEPEPYYYGGYGHGYGLGYRTYGYGLHGYGRGYYYG